MVGILTVFR